MAKITGMGMKMSIDDSSGTARDITNDITTSDWNTPRALQDVTGLDKYAHERLVLLTDFTIKVAGAGLDTAANQAHAVFKTVPSTSVVRTTAIEIPSGTAVLSIETLYHEYTITRAADGGLSWNTNGTISDGALPTYS